MRTARIRDSKFLETLAWTKEVCGYCEKKLGGGVKIHAWVDSFGDLGTIRWTIDAPDLAAIEKIQSALLMDQGYWQIVHKGVKDGLLVDGSGVDNIYREV